MTVLPHSAEHIPISKASPSADPRSLPAAEGGRRKHAAEWMGGYRVGLAHVLRCGGLCYDVQSPRPGCKPFEGRGGSSVINAMRPVRCEHTARRRIKVDSKTPRRTRL